MDADKQQLRVKLLGTVFTIQSTEKRERLDKILDYYRQKVEEVSDKMVASDALKIAIITGLNIVDELFKEREAEKASRLNREPSSGINHEELQEITDRLINKIDNSLNDLLDD